MNVSNQSSKNRSTVNQNEDELSDLNFDESALQLIDKPFDPKVNSSNLRTDYKYNGFDSTMGNAWIYPTNYPVRQYQHNISRVSLFKNTLVVLPTGLGKTFIAAVVMYNMFRWYPKGKIIFMAPTRPLVAQQIDSCYQIMGFPKDETVELTGRQNKKIRAMAWRSKRVFYCTPQVVWSDMNDNEIEFPINDIKLIVVDEAHKAKGKYAYTEVVQSIWSRNKLFRVLALSATPGTSMKDVCEVIQNLLISNIEVRRESSIDVAPYVFKKKIRTIVVPLGERLNQIRQRLSDLVEPYVENLMKHQVIGGHTGNLTKAWLLYDRNKFRESTITNRHPDHKSINSDFSICISMYHAIELLERHGMRVFLNYFANDNESNAEEKFFVMKDAKIKQFLSEIRANSGITPFTDEDMSFNGSIPNDDSSADDYGHPKFQILQKCLLDHFQQYSDTKAIVFCEYRESVFLINRMLSANRPLIKPKVFVGQGSSHNRTITQKEQIAIMNDFRSGKCNSLIATCVAEEGIDVGEVDFIVCFDVNNKNPTRYVQRIGRTGRKRQGKVTMLVTEGKEELILRNILATKGGINQKLSKSSEVTSVLYKDCPRLVPPEFNPQCIETFIDIKNTQEPSTSTNTNTKKATKSKNAKTKSKSPKQIVPRKAGDMRQFFKPLEIDNEIEENFDLSSFRGNTSKEYKDASKETFENLREDMNSQNVAYDQNTYSAVELAKSHDNDTPLEVKFEKVYDRYCNIKKAQSRWDDFSENLSKPAINADLLPDILKRSRSQHANDSNRSRIFKIEPDPWSSYPIKRRIQLVAFMSLLLNQIKTPNEMTVSTQENVNEQNTITDDSQMNRIIQEEQQSKYASQINDVKMLNVPALHQIASSTPNKMSVVRCIPPVPTHSPIVGSYTSLNSCKNQTNRPCAKDMTDSKWYLKYLGLSSAFDLFSDDDLEQVNRENSKRIINNSSDEREAKLCDNLNKSICGNESLIEEESQYTVSRILKICEDADKMRQSNCTEKHAESIPRRRRLYIGSVNDLFCEENDDDDDVIINTQTIDTSLTGSDDTINYDVTDAITNQNSMHNSTSLFKDTFGSQQSCKVSNSVSKPVTLVKSDELFSTYNETARNMSTVTSTSNIKPDQPEQSIQTTPKKSNNSYSTYNRSPSVLIKSTSVLSTKLDCNRIDHAHNTSKNSSNQSDKSPELLSKTLNILNTQISFTEHLDDYHEFKENFSSPFATCKTLGANQNQDELNYDTEFSENDMFATCKAVSPIKKSSPRKLSKKRKLRKKFNFIDDEAAVSGDESSDDDFIATQSSNFNITEQFEEDDPSVDMQAKYLQSIRSPVARRHFRIPAVGYRNSAAPTNIFSQFVAPDQSKYEEDSFVVGSDIDSDCTEMCTDDSTDMDEISILSRPNKRKSDDNKQSNLKKRRRIIEMSSDSD